DWRLHVVKARDKTNAFEAAAAGDDLFFEHLFDPRTKTQVGEAHDAGGNASRAVLTACRHGGLAVDKFDFADGLFGLRARRPVKGSTLGKHGLADVGAAARV